MNANTGDTVTFTVEPDPGLAALFEELDERHCQGQLQAQGWRAFRSNVIKPDGRRAEGVCCFPDQIILVDHVAPDARDSLLHEMAHAVAGARSNHGVPWLRAMARFIRQGESQLLLELRLYRTFHNLRWSLRQGRRDLERFQSRAQNLTAELARSREQFESQRGE